MAELLAAEDLVKRFPIKGGGAIRALNGVGLTLGAGETLGIVGESGCGKSTLGRVLLRLIEPTSGRVAFDGEDLLALGAARLRRRRRDMQLIFQDPFASLDPRMTAADIVGEPLAIHRVGTRGERARAVARLIELVGLPPEAGGRYPHEFSGGQRQRIGIARAIALEPKLIVADEPVSALDVSIQAQILNLLAELRRRLGFATLFISHDLAVVRHIADRVSVMYLGEIVESGPVERVFEQPAHPYTRALVSAIPVPDPEHPRRRIVLGGEPPNPESPPPGCPFHPRCPEAMERCRVEPPAARGLGAAGEGARSVRCHLY